MKHRDSPRLHFLTSTLHANPYPSMTLPAPTALPVIALPRQYRPGRTSPNLPGMPALWL